MNYFATPDKFSNNFALIDDKGCTLTYAELAVKANAFMGRLPGPRSIVAINCRNNIETVVAYLAALQVGHVVLLLDSSLEASLRQALLERFSINWLIDPDGTVLNLNNPLPELHDDLALLLSTSGSTGSPKLVKLTRTNLLSNAASIAEYLNLNETERPVTSLPFHYSYGLSVLNSHLLVGASILVTDEAVTQRRFWDFLREYEATSFAGVPYTYEMLHRLRFASMSLPSLRYYTQAGGRLRSDMVEFFAKTATEKRQQFIVMYGQTEATARIAYLPVNMVLTSPDSIGVAIPGGKLYLRDESDKLITQSGQIGELVYEGPNVMMGYATSIGDLILADQCEGYLCTGDLAYFDEQGLFYIAGRKKRFIKMLGNRLDLGQIELSLCECGVECAIIGEDDRLVVVGIDADPQAIKKRLQDMFHIHPSKVSVHEVESLPYGSSGKLQYGVLESKFLAGG